MARGSKRLRKKKAKQKQINKLKVSGYSQSKIDSLSSQEIKKSYDSIIQKEAKKEKKRREKNERQRKLYQQKKDYIKKNYLKNASPNMSMKELEKLKRKQDRKFLQEKKIQLLIDKGYTREQAEKFKNLSYKDIEVLEVGTGQKIFNIRPKCFVIGFRDLSENTNLSAIYSYSNMLSEEKLLQDLDRIAHLQPESGVHDYYYTQKSGKRKGRKRKRKLPNSNGRAGECVIEYGTIERLKGFSNQKQYEQYEFYESAETGTTIYKFKLRELAVLIDAILNNILQDDRLSKYTYFYNRICSAVPEASLYFPKP